MICAWQTRDSLVLTQSETLRYATLVNDYFMRTYPDVGAKSYVGNKERTSKIWTRSVYYEGLMSLYRQHQDERWLKYTEDWGNHHGWKASEKKQERHADFQCCGQAYLDMYMLNPAQTVRKPILKNLSMICLPRMWLMTGIGWMPYRWLCLFLPNWGQLKTAVCDSWLECDV